MKKTPLYWHAEVTSPCRSVNKKQANNKHKIYDFVNDRIHRQNRYVRCLYPKFKFLLHHVQTVEDSL